MIKAIFVFFVLLLLTGIQSCGSRTAGNNTDSAIADSTHKAQAMYQVSRDTDFTIKSVLVFDTLWNNHLLSFYWIDRVKDDSFTIRLDGFPELRYPLDSEFIVQDNQVRLLSINDKWKRCPVIFIGDSLCVYSIRNWIGVNRAMASVFGVDNHKHQLINSQFDTLGHLEEIDGQVYFIAGDARRNIFYVHSSWGPDSSEQFCRTIYRYRATSGGFVRLEPGWTIYDSPYDTLLYPYEGTPEGYRKYYEDVLEKHK